ncbi:bifunctional diguanylate cyclase/phosphodiesterase [Saccharospirillum salsuginis]|uniref:PAS domain S-box-containing protein/diguanylate cyclase (GGDEF) domain-containing protein n=1 Tax=Saccharospirillum salsuginis TaxID=418750 RepID=A0A918NGA1_9GAMM|nr:EAL domain-containing protein [Saccharospirillum salsuginis]GGX70913.1 hypothetical protein GCM10007392_42990 [Saccharospirillum salsuginis]
MPVVSLVVAIALLAGTFFTPLLADAFLAVAAALCLAYAIWREKRAHFWQLMVLAAVPVLPVHDWVTTQILDRDLHFQHMAVEEEMTHMANHIESDLIVNRSFLDAIVLLVGNQGDISQQQYSSWLDNLRMDRDFSFLDIALVQDYVITHVYPESEPNLAIVGVDLRAVPDQRDAVGQVMETRQPVVAGPLTVLQGDTAIIYRLPVPNKPDLVVTGVLSLDQILAGAVSASSQALRLRLSVERDGRTTELLSAENLSGRDIHTEFTEEGVNWRFSAEPINGWSRPVYKLWFASGGALITWLFLLIAFGWQYRAMLQRDRERLTLKTKERQLLEAQRLGRLGSWNTLKDGKTFAISAPLAELLGTGTDTLTMDDVLYFIYEPDQDYYMSQTQAVMDRNIPFTKFEHRLIAPDRLIWVEHSVALNSNGQLSGMLRDITDIKNTEAELQKLAYYDSLTGASNRNFFGKQVQQGIALSRRNGNHLALVLFDLDNFKDINAQYGHTIGDEVLKLLAERLKRNIRRSDTVARLSGDTFAVCLQNLKDPSHTIFVADTLLKSIAETLEVDRHLINVTGTLGIATCPEDDLDYEGLVKKAEMALLKAKEVDRGYYQFYSDQMNMENDRRQEILRLLPNALHNDEFHLVLQPRVAATDQRWSSIEVLIRWNSEVLGFVSPGEFIPIAEGSHLIVDIGYWVIREALRQFADHYDELDPDTVLSINLSPKQLEHRDLTRFVAEEIRKTGIPAYRLEFEITEHSLTEESETTLATLAELSNMGIRFAMDDFGTGYSNLGMLQALPLNVLKIDQRFVQRVETGGKDLELVRAIINMGHTLGLTVVAEGVETAQQVALLTELQCDELQGYYFYRPQLLDTLLGGLQREVTHS